MTIRFVLDESAWQFAADADPQTLLTAVHQLLHRLDVARERNEEVAKHPSYYEAPVQGDVQLFTVLFDSNCPIELERDIIMRLGFALDRASNFDETELAAYDAEVAGVTRFSPGIAWAHGRCSAGRQVAVLPLPVPEAPRSWNAVSVAGKATDVAFVVEDREHVGFFRSVISLENASEDEFEYLAQSAFPALDWADHVWRGLGDFSRPYINVRDELIRYLGRLNDYGATIFHQHRAHNRNELSQSMSARLGATTSDENGATKRYPPAIKDRTRRHHGVEKVFWWHIKLRPNVDRVYFRYESAASHEEPQAIGRIVVGIFKDHCILPS